MSLSPYRSSRALTGSVGLVLALAAGSALVGLPAAAATGSTTLATESFTGSSVTAGQWTSPPGSGACLTVGSATTQTPIPDCSYDSSHSPGPDADGGGALRLTNNKGNQVGTVYNTTSLPTAQGLDITFDTYQWDGSSADGIAFVLAATDPANPGPPTSLGPLGGSLGYSSNQPSSAGVANGYLGFGLDVFGNFENSTYGGAGCSDGAPANAVPESITVRGPGNGTSGYCVLNTQGVGTGGLDKSAATTRPSAVPVEIAVNPTGAAATTSAGLAVPADSWAMSVGTYNGSKTLTGLLPAVPSSFPAGWYDAATGLPYQLTFGWAASTGGSNEIHEVRNLTATSLTGRPPAYALSVADNEGGSALPGDAPTVRIIPSLLSSGGDEAHSVTVTATLPSGLTTPAAFTTADGYSCAATGQTVACTIAPSTPYAAGSTLPELDVPTLLSTTAAAGNYPVTAKVSSTDASPTVASDQLSVLQFGAHASAASAPYGTPETLSVTGLPAGAAGRVVFSDATGPLCTVTDTTSARSCGVPAPVVGSHAVTATYSPAAGSPRAAQSASTSFSVTRATPAFTVAADPATTAYGTTDSLTEQGLPATATGTVAFTDAGGATLCTLTLPATSCPTDPTLAPGTYDLTGTYSGDTNDIGGTELTTLTVDRAATTPTVSADSVTVTYGSTDGLTVGGLPATATGAVTFEDQVGNLLCSTTAPAGTCDTSGSLATGTYDVTAHYAGDADHLPGISGPVTVTVGKATPTVTAGAADPTPTYGSSDTLSWSADLAGAAGTVEFLDGGVLLCTATLPATSCLTPADLPAGYHAIVATYSGDGNHDGASSPAFHITVGLQDSSGLTAAATPMRTSYGTADTLSYSGLVLSGPSRATGAVSFTSGGRVLCTATLPATSCSAPDDLDAGSHPVVVTYSGDANHEQATTSTTFDVDRADVALSASVGAATVDYGTPDSLAYSGLATSGPLAVTGTVTFTAGGMVLCAVTLPASSCQAPAGIGAGVHSVTATYSGDADHTGATAGTSYAVVAAATQVTTSPAVATYGTAATLSAGGLDMQAPLAATGTLTFTDGNRRVLCTAALPATTCAAPAGLDVGTYVVNVSYSGDGNHSGSGAMSSLTVAPAPGSLTLTADPTRTTVGSPAGFVISGLPAGATGTVVITAGRTTVCTVTLPARSCTATAPTTAGSTLLTATYRGDGNVEPGTATATLTAVPLLPVTLAQAVPAGATSAILTPPTGATATTLMTYPAHGKATIVDGQVRYTPVPGYVGPDLLLYRAAEADGASRVVTVDLTVLAAVTSASSPVDGGIAAAPVGSGGVLPFTGLDLVGLVAAAAALLGLGLALRIGAGRRATR